MSDPPKAPSETDGSSSLRQLEEGTSADNTVPSTSAESPQATVKPAKKKAVQIRRKSIAIGNREELNERPEPPSKQKHPSPLSKLKKSIKRGTESFSDIKEAFSKGKSVLKNKSSEDSRSSRLSSVSSRLSKFRLRSRGDSAKDDYDFTAVSRAVKNTSLVGGIAMLMRGCLGAGMLTMHEAYKKCGMWTALPMNVLLGLIVTYSMYDLTTTAQQTYKRLRVPTMSYPDLAEAALEFGPCNRLRRYSRCFRHMTEVLICIPLLGGCCVYLLMISRAVKQLIDCTNGYATELWPPQQFYIWVLAFPCIIMGVYASVKVLAPFSIVLVFYVVVLTLTTTYYGVKTAKKNLLQLPAFESWSGLLEFIGVTIFAIDGIGITLPLENNLESPSLFPTVLFSGMSIVVIMVMFIGFFGYWGFGKFSISPITLNYAWGRSSVNIKMFLALMMLLNFSLNFWVPSNTLWFYIRRLHDPDRYWLWERFYKILLVGCITIGTSFIGDVSLFISMLGCSCLSNICLIFPALMSLFLNWETNGPGKYYWRVWKTALIVLFGLGCLSGTVINIEKIFETPEIEIHHEGSDHEHFHG